MHYAWGNAFLAGALQPRNVTKGGASAYQLYSGTSKGMEWISSYFDDPRDTAQIAAGYDYYQSGMWRVWPND